MAIPGVKKEEIAIEIEKDVLKVSSNVSTTEEVKEEKEETMYTRKEFNYASFERSFTLPEMVDRDAIKGKYEDGILSIELPKVEEAKTLNAWLRFHN